MFSNTNVGQGYVISIFGFTIRGLQDGDGLVVRASRSPRLGGPLVGDALIITIPSNNFGRRFKNFFISTNSFDHMIINQS